MTATTIAQVSALLPDPTWAPVVVSPDALESWRRAVENAGPTATRITVGADGHNALVADLAVAVDQVRAPSSPYRSLRAAPSVPVVGLARVEELAGLPPAEVERRRYLLAAARGAFGALRPVRASAAVPAAGFGWGLAVGAVVLVVIAGEAAYAAYRSSVDGVKLNEEGKTARAALAINARLTAYGERLAVFQRTGRMPEASAVETQALPAETANQIRTWADTAATEVSKAVTTLVVGGVVITVVAGVATVLSRTMGARRRRYIEV